MKYRNILKKRILAGLLAGAAACAAAPALAASGVVPNTQLPQGGNFVAGGGTIGDPFNGQMNITQNTQNGVIKWDGGFNIGANATVNFEGPQNGYNTLNYDASGNMSQIYGAINANNNGNIYIVNPAGVEISNSAQINVGSLYVSNKYLDNALKDINTENPDIPTIIKAGITQDTILMSLGNINADKVTFDGDRIVIDTERLKDAGGDAKLIDVKNGLTIRTTNADNVVIGYDAYDEVNGYTNAKTKKFTITEIKTGESGHIAEHAKEVDGYMWVEDVEQLQAIKDNLDGNYALRNSIDATATQDWNDANTDTGVKEGFQSIGTKDKAFTGKFDGLDYNIFNLNIKKDTDNVGLFGVVGEGAVINNVTLVGGSITGQNNVGALAGSVQGGAHISNITNSASVTGASNVGGIVGASVGTEEHRTVYDSLINTGTITSSGADDKKGGYISNAGGLIGYLEQGDLGGTSYNLGAVTGRTENDGSMIVGYNVGGLVGHAVNSVIGNEDMIDKGGNVIAEGTTVYNRLNVTGAYNVGGIVGNMEGTKVYNAENSGNVSATGYINETYSYHTAHDFPGTGNSAVNEIKTELVNIANVGGIAGSASSESSISGALNTGNVNSGTGTENDYTYYTAGNVGGIAGSAVDTNITNATNRENEIRGAHNVGGIAGYFSGSGDNADKKYTIEKATNDGGDIMATGARAVADGTHNNAATTPADDNVFYGYNVSNTGYALEHVRNENTGRETVIIGNMGGIVGYMDGDDVYIKSSANRGTVHSQEFTGMAPDFSKAANVGGIAGKIDRNRTKNISELGEKYVNAAVSNSYNTGDVMGYTGVGGIAGMMYNGEIAGSYNLGTVNTTRNAASFGPGRSYYSVNMGGIVGDTTEETNASALLYDVYNKGQIGDETFTYYARHVGGIVGRLSGTVEKAYNTGAIYNGYNVVGGIAGWFAKGTINNSFNTGNITVANKENSAAGVQAGGIAGGAYTGQTSISNVYNLGTIRGFQTNEYRGGAVGGIVGAFIGDGKASISNAYTTGNLYLNIGGSGAEFRGGHSSTVGLGSIYGSNGKYTQTVNTENTYYIRPDTGLPFDDLSQNGWDNSKKAIDFADKGKADSYQYTDGSGTHSLGFSSQTGGDVTVEKGQDWRIYDGSTPILNAFLPNAEDYFDQYTDDTSLNGAGIGSIQYGTAYDPLLTIINANGGKANLEFNWIDLGANNAAGIAVYGAGLTLNDFKATGGSGYYAGLLYADGALSIHAEGDASFGSAAELYGSSVTIDAKGDVTIYGDVTATGNTKDGTTVKEDGSYEKLKNFTTDGRISITGGNVDIYGQLTSGAVEETVKGIGSIAEGWTPGDVSDPKAAMSDIGDRFGYTTSGSAVDGNITITANDASDGHVNVYYGNQEEGFIDAAGSLYVEAKGDIYMDSDLKVGGGLTLTSPGEMVLDLTNIGQVQADKGLVTDALTGLHEFMHQFETGGNTISFQTNTSDGTAVDAKLTVDMWEDGAYDLTKYDTNGHTFKDELDQLNFTVQGDETASAAKYTYIWVSTGEQLAGIQQAADTNYDFLGYNFALKNDIDASQVQDYKAIGTDSEYNGTFDGRDNRIIGLDVSGDNAGIFSTIGKDGKVEDLRVYSGTFSGTNNAGAVAGVAGVNTGTIDNVTVSGTATAADGEEGNTALSAAGGIVGINMGDTAKISNSSSNSAVNASAESTYALGGAAGVNEGTLDNVDSLGVTTGLYKLEGHNSTKENQYSDNVGGIVGTNSGTVTNAYNESIVSGRDNVGGILGVNTATAAEGEDSPVSNVANASRVTGEANSNAAEGEDKTSDYVGGLVGDNKGSITNGRNNGEVTGNNYVGGLVGANRVGADNKKPELTNLVNDSAAAITGDNFVGGIAGSNAGTITAIDQQLVDRGSIAGQTYVGGVAGVNTETGVIANTISSIALHVKTPYSDDRDDSNDPKYFSGVVGQNQGTIQGATNESSVDVAADGASMVGGIIGENTETGKLEGTIANKGVVSGKSDVGGIIGSNKNDDILNNSAGADRLIVSNSGLVKAEDGGAAGIFYENTGAINNADLVNTGMVIGGSSKDSVTGGLFGKNSGEISNSTLTNNGTVYGGGTVGGLIGENKGNISYSSLINSTDGEVIGIQNVGGLIGVNTGDIIGGRDENDGYYKYQIYNNGTITAGTWTDTNGDGMIDEGEITAGAAGNDIAGLFGSNSGEVTAAYNTGAVVAGNSTNAGGIAGTNSGTLGQVFNTVMTGVNENGETQYGSITGNSNVGGLVGSNTGTISNAYNTSEVEGTTSGSLVGTNDGTVSNVYGSGADKLIGRSTGSTSNMYDLDGEGVWDKADSYKGFDFNDTWKIYEGSTNPLLKVFLTKLTVDGNTDLELVYNGQDQDIDIGNLLGNHITGPTGFADAYNNTKDNNGNSVLLENTNFEHKNAGEYDNWLYSGQIAASNGEDGFNPNNLGYDIDFKQDIDKAVIKVQGNTVDRTYGSSNISDNGSYGFIVSGVNTGELTSEMKQELTGGNLGFDSTQVSDGALSTETGRVTNDVSDNYTWSANLSLGDALKGNYVFEAGEGQDGTTTTVTGQSHVNKANLTINAGGDTIYVGGTPQFSGTANAFVNGDSFQLDFGMSADNANLPQTAGTYDGVVGFWYNGTFYGTQAAVDGATDLFGGNYKVTFRPGTLTVLDLPEGMPDISDIPSIERHWNFLFDDNPWDRNRDFRERKAEVHFVAGGMTL